MKAKNDARFSSVDYPIFIISVIVTTCFYLPMVVFQESSGKLIPKAMSLVSLDWCFETVCFLCVIFSLWLALGRFGRIKLGNETDEPEFFSTFTWIAMFFCAGIGAGAMYWAFLEPLYYLETPPFGIEAFSASAREWTLAYTSFHWGITPWAIFTVPAVAFAYVFYVRGCHTLRASIACGGILGHHAEGLIGKVIDI